jgi:hypothetical protein
MKGKAIVGILSTVAIVLLLGTHAAAQLAKMGTYKGTFGWDSTGKAFEMDDGRVIFVGEFTGALSNEAGKGFMHGTSWACPGITENLNDVSQGGNGYCIVTDTDGDKAFLTWTGKEKNKKAVHSGTFQWTGGTGKYSGLKGDNTYKGRTILPTQQGYNVHEGEWQLP